MIMVVFCYIITIPGTETERGEGGGYKGIRVKMFNNIFFSFN